MSFNWIFAILAGAFILFIAIYASSKIIDIGEKTIYTETAASLISLFDPLETGLASGKASEITFAKEARIFLDCNEDANPPFGEQQILYSEKTFRNEFAEAGEHIKIKDKYVFGDKIIQGKKLYYFTKPLFIGFKVSDLLMIYSDKVYCVYNADDNFRDDIEGLNLKNIFFPNNTEKCEGIRICFDGNKNCDIQIYDKEKFLIKEGRKLHYDNELIYAAIFSSPDIYECNVKRIKERYDELANIYLNKIEVIKRKECEPTLGPKLAASIDYQVRNSRDLVLFFDLADEINSINQRAKEGCKLYYNINFGR